MPHGETGIEYTFCFVVGECSSEAQLSPTDHGGSQDTGQEGRVGETGGGG